MFKLFSKCSLSAVLAFLSLGAMNSSLVAQDCCCEPCCPCDNNRFYVGAFGGGLFSNSSRMYQMGTAYFVEADGGPLAVNASGRTKSISTGFGGVQVGYEWSKCGCSNWNLATALELEGYWFNHNKKGHLLNNADRLDEHDFLNSFKVDTGVYLVNAVFALNSPCLWGFSPYIGVGAGAARISLKNGNSLQTAPLEEGINHFNNRRNDSSWAFAAQAKAGLRYNICNMFHLFGEYRYLFIDSSNYIFGSTNYPTHAPTSPWNVKVDNTNYNAFVFGIQFDL